MLFTAKEMDPEELPDITIKDAVYLAGYSQGGWATLALHEALEKDYPDEFNLKGSVCGAGPYDLNILFRINDWLKLISDACLYRLYN